MMLRKHKLGACSCYCFEMLLLHFETQVLKVSVSTFETLCNMHSFFMRCDILFGFFRFYARKNTFQAYDTRPEKRNYSTLQT